jgi:hypothetical protein
VTLTVCGVTMDESSFWPGWLSTEGSEASRLQAALHYTQPSKV